MTSAVPISKHAMSKQTINTQKVLKLIGAASCIGARDTRCDMGPAIMQNSRLAVVLNEAGISANWENILHPQSGNTEIDAIVDLCEQLAKVITDTIENGHQFAVIGGDHSCAVGTWSGAANALKLREPEGNPSLGLIWIDAHMDCHTPDTSPSGAYHGMPLACLLDKGPSALRDIGTKGAKLRPQHVCLVGVRSYESAEASLLKQLGVKVFFMDEVKQRGLSAVMDDVLSIVKNTTGFGLSIDLDAIDPVDAPGVGSPTQDGLQAENLIENIVRVKQQKNFIGTEITEFNPFRDVNGKTANLIIDLICATG